jgi:methylenetetrahydrofolate dehydrogenase (NADP+) / methenyltetrahydrofolate cyclohydrolase
MEKKISGKAIAQIIDKQIPTGLGKLVILMASPDPATLVWTKQKQEKAAALGIHAELINYAPAVQTAAILEKIAELNHDHSIAGILVQLPLYPHLEPDRLAIINAVNPAKDIDGLTAVNQGKLAQGLDTFLPATVAAILEIIKYAELEESYQPEANLDLAGKHAVIISHSILIGRPLTQTLLNHNATVTICHEYTKDLAAFTSQADILITATGKVGLIDHKMVKTGILVIDVSTVKTEVGLKGDVVVDEEFIAKVKHYTPVPGGVGPLTTSCLMANLAKT